MSHVSTIDIEIRDLQSLRKACDELGLEFVEGQTTFNWFGESVGDYPIPEGFVVSDLGKCEHAIRIKGKVRNNLKEFDASAPYEIGVVARRDGKPGVTLLYDFFGGGNGIMEKVGGNKCNKLVQSYQEQVARKQTMHLQAQGWKLQRVSQPNGHVQLKLTK